MSKAKETIILYHAYGLKALHHQVIFSILTLHHHLNGDYHDIKVVVYTDDKNIYKKIIGEIPITYESLTSEKIREFKGAINFIHRVKIKVIKDCFEKFNSNILYLDSDTYFLEKPRNLLSQIDDAKSVMNSNDYDLNNADELYENLDWLMIRRAIRDHEYKVEGKKIKIPLTTRMWNAGVIGLSINDKYLLDNVLDLTDQIYRNQPVFTAEQFSFSYYLQNKTSLISSGNIIFHYWPNFIGKYWKNLYSYHFNIFFKQNAKASITKKAQMAYELTLKHEMLVTPIRKTIFQRIVSRLKSIGKVTLKGKLS